MNCIFRLVSKINHNIGLSCMSILENDVIANYIKVLFNVLRAIFSNEIPLWWTYILDN